MISIKTGNLPIDAYTAKYKTGQVQAERSKEAHYSTHGVPGEPLHGERPRYLQGHHQERHLQQFNN